MVTSANTSGLQPLRIAGVGRYIPDREVYNEELEERFGGEPGWISKHLGIDRRFWAEGETPSEMGAEAAGEALAQAGIDAEDIDLIINASGTASFERILPEGGAMIQQRLGLGESGIPAFTIQAAGMSFVAAMQASAGLLASGRYQSILLVCSELFSRNLDESDPAVYGRFADGAAAVVATLPSAGERSALHGACLRTYGEGSDWMRSHMGLDAFRLQGLQPLDLALKIDRQTFEKQIAARSAEVLDELLALGACGIDDISLFIPQQWGEPYFASLEERIPGAKLVRVAGRLGYCGAASLPMALYEAQEKGNLNRGDRLAMFGCDAGLTAGGLLMTY